MHSHTNLLNDGLADLLRFCRTYNLLILKIVVALQEKQVF